MNLAMYAFGRMYLRMRQMERATAQVSAWTDDLTDTEKAAELGRVPGMSDISIAVGDNGWYGREAATYAQVFIAALAAEDDENPGKYQKILADIDNQLRNS